MMEKLLKTRCIHIFSAFYFCQRTDTKKTFCKIKVEMKRKRTHMACSIVLLLTQYNTQAHQRHLSDLIVGKNQLDKKVKDKYFSSLKFITDCCLT
jgi:hypothetical protein